MPPAFCSPRSPKESEGGAFCADHIDAAPTNQQREDFVRDFQRCEFCKRAALSTRGPDQRDERNVIAQLAALWRGNLPLGQAFWEYAIAYGTIANIGATGAAMAAVMVGLPDIIAMFLFLSPLPYILAAVVGVLRSANKHHGAPEWAAIAKIAVIVSVSYTHLTLPTKRIV